MEKFNQILNENFDSENRENIVFLYDYLSQFENSENLILKGIDIAEILLKFKIDSEIFCSCILLPFLRENVKFSEEILTKYEDSITLSKAVIKISEFSHLNKQQDMENIRAMLMAIAKDVRAILIRLCEVLYLARHTKDFDKQFVDELFDEIKNIYAPIASRFGLTFIKLELNDLTLLHDDPNEYKRLMKSVADATRNGTEKINNIVQKIGKVLNDMDIKGECFGRVKHISSIYNKIQSKNKTLAEIYDLYAIRVLVDSPNDCYAVLGSIHTEFEPLDGRFKDYIAKPKENGYQSLHTVVLIDDEPFEIQIRTHEMNKHAEYGIAAHFLYKEHKTKLSNIDDKLIWIKKLIENTDNLSTNEILQNLKIDIYVGEIFVQSPMGKVVQLAEYSTPIDFAYAIHSEVGNRCVGAKVNGKMVPLSTTLANGDIVEILTSQNAKGPSRDWLNFAKTSNAKNRINQFFRHEMKDENIKKGKTILEEAAKNKGYQLSKLFDPKWVPDLLQKYAFHDEDEMLAALGYGSITSAQILNRLINEYEANNKHDITEIKTYKQDIEHNKTDIEGLSGIMVKYAKCCNPIPGDEIVGFVSRGNGVTIHRQNCQALDKLEQNRLMPISWGSNLSENQNYIASLKLYVDNGVGILSTISTKIAENKINITKITSTNTNNNEAIINLSFYIKNKQQLDDFINKLQALPVVHDVVRGGK